MTCDRQQRLCRDPGAWGAQAGISLSSSPGASSNETFWQAIGFNFREQLRTTPPLKIAQAARSGTMTSSSGPT
jgi:hypothetical protein